MNRPDAPPRNLAAAGPPPPSYSRSVRRSWPLIGLTTGWVLFVVLHRLISGRWWLWLAPDLIPPLTFAIAPLLLVALALVLRRERRRVGILGCAALALGAGLSGLNPYALTSGPSAAPPGAIRILSWNTERWNHSNDARRFYGFLRSYDADIYLLQEYKPYDQAADQKADLSRLRHYFTGYHIATIGELLTISRYPITAVQTLPTDPLHKADWRRIRQYPLGPHPPAMLPAEVRWRTLPAAGPDWPVEYWSVKVIRTDVRIRNRLLSVYNVHMPTLFDTTSPLTAAFYDRRRWYLERRLAPYRDLCSSVTANRLPVFVAGDFNTSAAMGNEYLQCLAGRLRDAAHTNRSPYPASWPAQFPLWRLDWAFTSRALRVHDYRFRDPEGMSDHRAQDLTVSLR